MLRDAFDHPKIRKLARRIGYPIWAARGLAESLWHVTAKLAPHGDLGRLDNEDIADQIGWDEDPDQLIDALVAVRLLDQHPDHRLIVHDWHEHCDSGVRQKLKRRGEDFVQPASKASGGAKSPPSEPETAGESGQSDPDEPDDSEHDTTREPSAKAEGGLSHNTLKHGHNISNPLPAQRSGCAGSGTGSGTGAGPGTGDGREPPPSELGRYPEEFQRLWQAYPAKGRRGIVPTFNAWLDTDPHRPPTDELLARLDTLKRSDTHWLNGYVPRIDRWLRDHGWEDAVHEDEPSPSAGGVDWDEIENEWLA
jgi:hypothetical protein